MESPMASKMLLALLVSLSLLLPSASAGVICEELPKDLCAYAVSSASKRCVLESYQLGRMTEYQCRTSEMVVDRKADYVESDKCVKACGVDRNTVGFSSDALHKSQFTMMLCSLDCYQHCDNVVDLYFNLAAREGMFLPDMCNARHENPYRAMLELMSTGAAPSPNAATPVSTPQSSASAPASAPVVDGQTTQSSETPAPAHVGDEKTGQKSDNSVDTPAPTPAHSHEPSFVDKVIGLLSDKSDDAPAPAPAHAASAPLADRVIGLLSDSSVDAPAPAHAAAAPMVDRVVGLMSEVSAEAPQLAPALADSYP